MCTNCRECGLPFTAKRDRDTNSFCAVECRKAFNNRRMTRGAQLYDLFMMVRYERGLAKARGLWTIVCRLALEWRQEDERQRAGRKSWREYAAIHDGLLPLRVEIMGGKIDAHRAAVENGIAARSLRN
jgi:hypothetical protein